MTIDQHKPKTDHLILIGNGATLTRLKKTKIWLPINDKNEIDYEFIENYTKILEKQKLENYIQFIKNYKKTKTKILLF